MEVKGLKTPTPQILRKDSGPVGHSRHIPEIQEPGSSPESYIDVLAFFFF